MNNFINLAHLKFFCDMVLYQSISEAAKKNFISQSAVSQAINKLENIFGVPLVIHNKQKLYLTEQGQIVFDQATEIFKSINETFIKVNNTKDEITGDFKFATTRSLAMSFFAPTYKKIKKNLPHLKTKIKMGGITVIRTALKREEVEFAIVVYNHNFSQFAKHTIKKGIFHLYQSKADAQCHQLEEKNWLKTKTHCVAPAGAYSFWVPYPGFASLQPGLLCIIPPGIEN